MSAQTIEKEFFEYWLKLSALEKESLLVVAKNYVSLKNGNVDLEQYNMEIDQALERVNTGDFLSHTEVTKMVKDW